MREYLQNYPIVSCCRPKQYLQSFPVSFRTDLIPSILRDKTMDDKFMYITDDDKQN